MAGEAAGEAAVLGLGEAAVPLDDPLELPSPALLLPSLLVGAEVGVREGVNVGVIVGQVVGAGVGAGVAGSEAQ